MILLPFLNLSVQFIGLKQQGRSIFPVFSIRCQIFHMRDGCLENLSKSKWIYRFLTLASQPQKFIREFKFFAKLVLCNFRFNFLVVTKQIRSFCHNLQLLFIFKKEDPLISAFFALVTTLSHLLDLPFIELDLFLDLTTHPGVFVALVKLSEERHYSKALHLRQYHLPKTRKTLPDLFDLLLDVFLFHKHIFEINFSFRAEFECHFIAESQKDCSLKKLVGCNFTSVFGSGYGEIKVERVEEVY